MVRIRDCALFHVLDGRRTTGERAYAGASGLFTLLLGGLFKVAIRANLLHDAFLVENLLHALERTVDGLAFLQTDNDHTFVTPLLIEKVLNIIS